MFIGEYQHVMDEKGRVSIPAKFRDELGDDFVITKGMDGCLFVFSKERWERADEKINELMLTRKESRAFTRLFFAGASQQSLDKQGRALIPPNLRKYAQLDRDVIIIGVSNRVEIWDLDRWTAYSVSDEFDYDVLAEHMEDLTI